MKRLLFGLVALFLLVLSGCAKKEEAPKVTCKPLSDVEIQQLLEKVKQTPMEPVAANEQAVLETNYGKMVLAFFPDKAPMHCTSFKRLVVSGYYDCTTFHRVIPGFMIQGGDINSKDTIIGNEGTGGPGFSLPAEFNDSRHDKGVLSMARSQDPNSAGSQFFICLGRERTGHLDGQYTVFGKLIEGMDVLEKIGQVQTAEGDAPVLPVVITKAYMQLK
jgi:peptidyl-prolyl cis-trans isomerase B (cyclophilin B)